ncbi:MAG: Lrp/AsnC family transcriptional regulator, partial [Burkholderiales bacterium]|nr:Lrp/AsnC family transcriptional regulator [Burkholderiales bacterium]
MSNKYEVALDQFDVALLRVLQTDARVPNVTLAEKIHLSPAPCLRRVRDLETAGVIQRYVTLLNPHALGLGVSVFIQVSLEKQVGGALHTFEQVIHECPEVMECYLMTGDSDYLLRVVTRNLESLQHFIVNELAKIPHVANIRSSIALQQIKYKT